MSAGTNKISWQDFSRIDMRVGTIINAKEFPEAKMPAYKLEIDFGEMGIKKSSAQITQLYDLRNLIGRKIIAVVNFPPKQIANFMSECLVLGAVGESKISLLSVDKTAANGERVL